MDNQSLQTTATIVTMITAIAAIAFGYYQFEQQLDLANLIAHANIKPLLEIRSDNSNNEMSVNLTNLGLGTAVITSIKFYRDNDVNSSVYDPYKLTNFPYDFYTWKFAENVTYMRPGEIRVMARITRGHLKNIEKQPLNDNQIEGIFKSWADQISGIHVKITYTDVLVEKQKDIDNYLEIV